MARVKRQANYIATLVYVDEPQVVHLMSRTVPVVAVAVPSNDPNVTLFAATTATLQNWEGYLNGASDLRYLFTYPASRSLYTFDLQKMVNKKVIMIPWEGPFPEEYLPQSQFFSRDHTEPYLPPLLAPQTETLLVDGEWELQEFGAFYQRYSDIYAFLVAVMNWKDAGVAADTKSEIKNAFRSKPFEGGSSYLHFFGDLFSSLRRGERLGLDKVAYASPGHVDINGRDDAFGTVEQSLSNFLQAHGELHRAYSDFHQALSKAGLLRMPGEAFLHDDPNAQWIKKLAREFALALKFDDFDELWKLSNGNALVAAKILLSFYRRLEQAGEYFAQGRVSFGN